MPDSPNQKPTKISELEQQLETATRQLDQLNKEKDGLDKEIQFIRTSMLDINKLSFEAMKHLTTLSAGSILLLVTFLEKIFSNHRRWSALIGLAVSLFIISIVAAMYALMQSSMVITEFLTGDATGRGRSIKKVLTELTAFVAFTLGIVSLGVFALRNFY